MKIILFTISILFAGCASTAITQMINEPETNLKRYEYFTVDVGKDDTILKEDIDEAFIDLLKDTIIRKIFEKKLSAKIIYNCKNIPNKLLSINVSITDLNKVTAIERFLIGAFAGQATVGVKVDFYDKNNSKIISEAIIIGESSGGSIFAGTTSEAIEKASEQIANLIEKYFKG